MEIDLMYIRGVIDSTLDEYEQINGLIDEDKDLLITVEPFSGSQKNVIGAKVNISAITSIKKTFDLDGITDIKKEYYDNYIVIYKTDKLASFKSDLFDELTEIDKIKISDY